MYTNNQYNTSGGGHPNPPYQYQDSNVDKSVPQAVPYNTHLPQAQISSLKPQDEVSTSGGGCRDLPFAILFIANVVGICVVMGMYGINILTGDAAESSGSFFSKKEAKTVLLISLVLSIISAVISFAMIQLFVKFAACMIHFSLWFSVVTAFALCGYGVYTKNYVLAIIAAVLGLISICYAYAVRDRIPFAVANLKVAAAGIKTHCSTYVVAFAFLIIQIGWVLIWSLALLGLTDHLSETNEGGKKNGFSCLSNTDCESNYCVRVKSSSRFQSTKTCQKANLATTSYVAYFFMLLSLYFGLQVFKNIVHCTIAGTIATWWSSNNSSGATGAALRRSCTTSLGSICFGSLIVAILQALRTLAQEARQQGDAFACIAECILGCLESLMEYFNKWAFVYVGIYGYKFTQAGKAVFELFGQRGFDAIINDDLIGNVLSFISLAIGLLCAGLAVAFHYAKPELTDFKHAAIILGIVGFFVGAGISLIPLSVIDSTIATVFVCFAEDPATFAMAHPDLYGPLIEEWYKLYPDIMIQSGYYYVA